MVVNESSNKPAGIKIDPRVMVIGEDEVSSKELALLLEEAGIDATLASNTYLKKLGAKVPSIVLVEEKAGQGGWEVSSQIRKESDIPIILLGDSSSEIAWAKAAAYGVDCYLVKPFSSRELVARIRTLIRRHDGTIQGFAGSETQKMPSGA